MRRIAEAIFVMFCRHKLQGSPVVADCAATKLRGVWLESPAGKSAFMKTSAALAIRVRTSAVVVPCNMGQGSAERSREIRPGFAWLTSAMGCAMHSRRA